MKAYQVLIFLCSVLFLIVGICLFFPKEGFTLLDKTFRFPTLVEAMTKKSHDTETAEEKLAKAEAELQFKIEQDSLRKVYEIEKADSLAFIDTLRSYQKLVCQVDARIDCPDDDVSILFPLFDELDKCKTSNNAVHILHYGDSQIEQDRITGYIRERLQNYFGGWGPGLVPAVQPIPSMSVDQSVSDSLPRFIADGTMRQKLSHDRYGVLGQMALQKRTNSFSFAARNWKKTFPHVKKFSKVSLFIGNSGADFSARISYNGKDSTQNIVEAQPDMSILTWNLNENVSRFSLKLTGEAELYAVFMGSKNGVSMTNVPLRGSSGTFFTKISRHLLNETMEALNTRLIILEFGGNATPYLKTEEGVENYKNSIVSQIKYLKKCCPRALILLIGPADMSTMVEGNLQSYPFLEVTIDALRNAALENGAMFWNMYQVMGGKDSMIKWVGHSPAWAASDYIHFTEQGANRIAEVFVKSFFNTYDYYHFLKRNSKWVQKMDGETEKTNDETLESDRLIEASAGSLVSVE